MSLKWSVCAGVLLAGILTAGCEADPPAAEAPEKTEVCGHPSKPGTYKAGKWEYTYAIERKGTQSETRRGQLKRNGKPVKGNAGQVRETPVGKFLYFGDRPYNRGWLNTTTYDQPVFDGRGRVRRLHWRLALPDKGQAKVMWAKTGDKGEYSHLMSTAGPGGRVYVWSRTALYAFDADGSLAWRRPVIKRVDSMHALPDGDVLLQESDRSGNPFLTWLAPDGKARCKHHVRLSIVQVTEMKDGRILLVSMGKGAGGAIRCFAPGGVLRWKLPRHTDRVRFNSRGNLVFAAYQPGGLNARLECVSPEGKVLWTTARGIGQLMGLDASDRILVRGGWATKKKYYGCVYSADGKLLWHVTAENGNPGVEKDARGNFKRPPVKASSKER